MGERAGLPTKHLRAPAQIAPPVESMLFEATVTKLTTGLDLPN